MHTAVRLPAILCVPPPNYATAPSSKDRLRVWRPNKGANTSAMQEFSSSMHWFKCLSLQARACLLRSKPRWLQWDLLPGRGCIGWQPQFSNPNPNRIRFKMAGMLPVSTRSRQGQGRGRMQPLFLQPCAHAHQQRCFTTMCKFSSLGGPLHPVGASLSGVGRESGTAFLLPPEQPDSRPVCGTGSLAAVVGLP